MSTEDEIPVDHPIRRIGSVVDTVLAELDDTVDAICADVADEFFAVVVR